MPAGLLTQVLTLVPAPLPPTQCCSEHWRRAHCTGFQMVSVSHVSELWVDHGGPKVTRLSSAPERKLEWTILTAL